MRGLYLYKILVSGIKKEFPKFEFSTPLSMEIGWDLTMISFS